MDRLLILLFLAIGFCTPRESYAQSDANLWIFGQVMHAFEKDTLTSFQVVVTDIRDDSHIVEASISESGKYQLELNENRKYKITFGADGLYSQHLTLDLRYVTKAEWGGGGRFSMQIDQYMYRKDSGLPKELFMKPIGHAWYDSNEEIFTWNRKWTEKWRAEMTKHEAAYKEHLTTLGLLREQKLPHPHGR